MKKIIRNLIWVLLLFLGGSLSGQVDTVRVGIRMEAPFVLYDEVKDQYYGLSIDLWEQIAAQENLVFRYERYPDLLGIIRALDYEELDITINPVAINSTRLKMFEASQPFYISSIGLATKRVRKSKFGEFVHSFFSFQFLRVLLLLIFTIFVFGTLLWFAERRQNQHQFRPGFKGLIDGIWWSAVTMTTVGYGDKSPKSIAGRIIAIIWMFTALFILSGFIASITSALTLTSFKADIKSIEDLSAVSTLGTINNSNSSDFLLRNQLEISHNYETANEGIQALLQDEIDALVYDRTSLRYLIDDQHYESRAVLLPVRFNAQYRSFLFPKESPLIDQINPILVDLLNDPLWAEMMERYNLYLNE